MLVFWPFKSTSPITKEARLTRYTVHPIRCEVCREPLKNGDLLFTFDHVQDGRKVGEHTVLAHADCMVHLTEGDMIVGRSPHRESPVLSKDEWEAWKDAVGVKEAPKESDV